MQILFMLAGLLGLAILAFLYHYVVNESDNRIDTRVYNNIDDITDDQSVLSKSEIKEVKDIRNTGGVTKVDEVGEVTKVTKVGENTKKNREKEEVEEREESTKNPIQSIMVKSASDISPAEHSVMGDLCTMSFGPKSDMSLKENSRVFVAYDKNGNILGMAAILILDQHDFWGAFGKYMNYNLDLNSIIIYNFCVHPEMRGRGVGQSLLNEIERWARLPQNNKNTLALFVKPENSGAIRLYNRNGYLEDGFKNSDGSEIVMRKSL